MMAEEKTFQCVFGYGDCPIQALIAKQRQQSMMVAKAIPLDLGKDLPKDVREGLSVFMQAIIGSMSRLMQTAGDLSILGNFCTACPKAWKQIGKVMSEETQQVKPAEKPEKE